MISRSLLSLLLVAGSTFGSSPVPQHRADPRNQHERIMVVVPMIGAGAWSDPTPAAVCACIGRAERSRTNQLLLSTQR
jgi:hypothetical protein